MSTALTAEQVELIRASFNAVAPKATELIDLFYTKLFETAPSVRSLFPQEMSDQKDHLLSAVKLVATKAHDLASIEGALGEMGARHVGYGAEPEHYPVVRDTMLDALHDIAGPAWTNDIEEAWTDALNIVAGIMLAGAEKKSINKAA